MGLQVTGRWYADELLMKAGRKREAIEQRDRAAAVSSWSKLPVRTKRVAPRYPPRAREKEIEGWVEIMFTIATNGSTEDVHVVEADPDDSFERAALFAVRNWKYRPGERDGRVAAQRNVRVRLNFDLDK